MNYSPLMRGTARLATFGVLALSVAIAQADLKIVSQTTVNTKRGPKTVSIITFMKGSKIRVDNLDVSQITDSRTGQNIYINNSRQIYTTTTNAQIAKLTAESIKNEHMKVSAKIRPTGKTKMIAGKMATQYVGDVTLTGNYPKIPGSTATAVIHLDEWTIQSAGITVGQGDMLGQVGLIVRSVAGTSGMGKVTAELSKAKGIPLNIDVNVDVKITTAGGGAPQTQHHSYVTEAQFVRDGALPDSLFSIPKGYKEVHDPSMDAGKNKKKGGK